jgi:hypothetical protein
MGSEKIPGPRTGSSVADQDPGLFYPLDPGSGSAMNFFRPHFLVKFLTLSSESLLCYLYETKVPVLIKRLLKPYAARKKCVCYTFFNIGLRIRDPRSGMKKF